MQRVQLKKAVCWLLTAVCMTVIFYFSSRTATDSANQSGRVLQFFQSIFGDNLFTDFIVRKSAHCLEFAGLSLLFNFSLLVQTDKKHPFQAVLYTSLYAVTDELHQLFVEGRACRISDWGIDTAGAILGALGFMILYAIIKKNYRCKTDEK